MSDYTLYGNFNSQPSMRVALFLSMAGIDYAYRHLDLRGGQQKSPEYLAINRFGRVPTLVDKGAPIAESAVILTYLADQTGQFGGRDADEKRRLAEWLSWIADVLVPVQRARAIHKFNGDANALHWIEAAAASGLEQFDAHLADHEFVEGGRVTIADIFAFPWIDLASEAEIDLAPYPHVSAWLARMHALPGVKAQYDLMPRQDVG